MHTISTSVLSVPYCPFSRVIQADRRGLPDAHWDNVSSSLLEYRSADFDLIRIGDKIMAVL